MWRKAAACATSSPLPEANNDHVRGWRRNHPRYWKRKRVSARSRARGFTLTKQLAAAMRYVALTGNTTGGRRHYVPLTTLKSPPSPAASASARFLIDSGSWTNILFICGLKKTHKVRRYRPLVPGFGVLPYPGCPDSRS